MRTFNFDYPRNGNRKKTKTHLCNFCLPEIVLFISSGAG